MKRQSPTNNHRPSLLDLAERRSWLRARRPVMTIAILGAFMGAGMGGIAPSATAQDGGSDLWGTARANEQELIKRQILQLRLRITKLIPRFEEDGRPEAAKILRNAVALLDERPEDKEGRTLEELLGTANSDLKAGRYLAATERGEWALQRVTKILDVLQRRDSEENLEENLTELREVKAALENLKSEEEQLREETEQLVQESTTAEQREIQSRIQDALQAQREELRKNEQSAQDSGLFDAEQLLDELRALGEDQQQRAEALDQANAVDLSLIHI